MNDEVQLDQHHLLKKFYCACLAQSFAGSIWFHVSFWLMETAIKWCIIPKSHQSFPKSTQGSSQQFYLNASLTHLLSTSIDEEQCNHEYDSSARSDTLGNIFVLISPTVPVVQ